MSKVFKIILVISFLLLLAVMILIMITVYQYPIGPLKIIGSGGAGVGKYSEEQILWGIKSELYTGQLSAGKVVTYGQANIFGGSTFTGLVLYGPGENIPDGVQTFSVEEEELFLDKVPIGSVVIKRNNNTEWNFVIKEQDIDLVVLF